MSPGCDLPWTISPDLRSQPLCPLHPSFRSSVPPYLLPYYLIGNEAESEAWASANGLPNLKGLPAVTKALAQQQKSNLTRDRVVVFTRGATIAVCSSSPVNVKTCAVDALKDEGVVDTDGAGDAFAGNLPGILAAGKSLDRVIEVGHTLGTMCIAQAGPQYKWPKVVVLW